MRTIITMFNMKRRGVSTILGTMIFIGILFTSVIPMFLVMKQADNIYTRNVHEMEISDQDRASEAVEAYAYPLDSHSTQIYVEVKNTGVLPVKIVRVWINDDIRTSASASLAIGDTIVLPFTIDLPDNDETYIVMVTTERGNVFTGDAPLNYKDGHWVVTNLLIYTLISTQGTEFKLELYKSTTKDDPNPIYLRGGMVLKQGNGQGSVLYTFDVTLDGVSWYRVKVKKGNQEIHNECVYVTDQPPNPSPYVWIYS